MITTYNKFVYIAIFSRLGGYRTLSTRNGNVKVKSPFDMYHIGIQWYTFPLTKDRSLRSLVELERKLIWTAVSRVSKDDTNILEYH